MNLVNRITCPSCHTPLKSMRGVRIGRKIKCVKCEIAFTVRAEDADQAERTTGVNTGRFLVVLAAALVFLGGGGALAVFCFADNVPRQPVSPSDQASQADDEIILPPAPTAASPGKNPAPPTLTSAEQRAIDKAIAKGVWFLKDHAFADGVWSDPNAVGLTALPALALLECGVPADDPQMQKTAVFVREHAVLPTLNVPVYQRSLAILFLDRLGDKRDEELIQYLALCIIAGQDLAQGAWHYNCPTLDRQLVPQLLRSLKDGKQSLKDWRKTALHGGSFNPGGWDNSNTQFAVLALWVAQRHGVSIDRPAQLVEQHFRKTQHADGPDSTGNNQNLGGSWLYDANGNSSRWPSMTCAGLLALAVGHGLTESHTEKAKPLDDQAIQRALAMLAREINRPDEPRPHDLYFLWSLERVGVLYDLAKIGGKDWYAWGRKDLLAKQQNDGSWTDGGYYGSNNILDTCFALLFLKQANLAKDLTNKLQLLGIGVSAGPSVQAPAKKD